VGSFHKLVICYYITRHDKVHCILTLRITTTCCAKLSRTVMKRLSVPKVLQELSEGLAITVLLPQQLILRTSCPSCPPTCIPSPSTLPSPPSAATTPSRSTSTQLQGGTPPLPMQCCMLPPRPPAVYRSLIQDTSLCITTNTSFIRSPLLACQRQK
jgi:hypothetical protein